MSLVGCFGPRIGEYASEEPTLDLREYFNGPIKAWGLVQNRRGRVVRRFDISLRGRWEGEVGTLEEHFVYYDGETQERTWTIRQRGARHYTGTAGDISGEARGESSGNAVRWSYVMQLPVGDTRYEIAFDDWMFLMNDGVLINRSYLRKFGVKVAELTIFMQKQPE